MSPMALVTGQDYEVALRCPDCEEVTMVGVELSTVLTHPTGETATLKLRAKSSKVIHHCRQPNLFDSTDVIIDDTKSRRGRPVETAASP